MNIIAGKYRGKKLISPKTDGTRPTLSRVKESIFNIIQCNVRDAAVLDLFAGTGQMGIECLSRAARSVDFVDIDRAAIEIVRKNCAFLDAESNYSLFNKGYDDFLKSCKNKYSLIFLDPPYKLGMLNRSIELIETFDILDEDGIIICETPAEQELVSLKYTLSREYKYGAVKVTLCRHQGGL